MHVGWESVGVVWKKKRTAVLFAILAATLYAVHVPLSKILMQGISPAMLAGFLYLGAGTGMGGIDACPQALR